MPPTSDIHTAITQAAKGKKGGRNSSSDSRYGSTASSHEDGSAQRGHAGARVSSTAAGSQLHQSHAARDSSHRTGQLTDAKHAADLAPPPAPGSSALKRHAGRQQPGKGPLEAVSAAGPAVGSGARNSACSLDRGGSSDGSSGSSSAARSCGTTGMGLWSCKRSSASQGAVELPQALLPLSGCRRDQNLLDGPAGANTSASPEHSGPGMRERRPSRLSGSAAQLAGSTRAQALLRKTLSACDRPQPPQLAPDKARQTSSFAPRHTSHLCDTESRLCTYCHW